MSAAKHTPGPWTWLMEKQDRGPIGKGEMRHVSLSAPRPGHPLPYSTRVLGPNWTVHNGDVWQAWVSVREADARLIAAAPKMLTALLAAQQFIRNGIALGFIRMPDADCPDSAHNTPPLIDEAIFEATGEAT